jgi:hypothetical protein
MAQVCGVETSGSTTGVLVMIQFDNIKLKVYKNIYHYFGYKIAVSDDVHVIMLTCT